MEKQLSLFELSEENIQYPNKSVYLHIRKELRENEVKLLESAELLNLCPIEAWTAVGTNKDLSYLTHGAFRYFGKFPPPIASYLIQEYTLKDDLVWDLMCGSGTTGVEAILLNRFCNLNDVNPLSRLISRVKTRYIDKEVLENAMQRIINNYKPLTKEQYWVETLENINYEHWFLPETINSLLGIKYLIDQEENENVKEFLLLVLASTVRRVSKATTQQGRLFLDIKTACEDAVPIFIKKGKNIIEGISSLPKDSNDRVNVFGFNLKNDLPTEFYGSTKLVILHPPYFNSYKYSSINSLEMSWLGYNHAEIRKEEVREFFKVGKAEKVQFYVEDMITVIRNASKLLKKNGILALMIGDTVIKREHIKVTRQIIDRLKHDSDNILSLEKIALRVPKYTEASWVASQRRKSNDIGINLYDYVILFRRK